LSGREKITIDGCPLACSKACLGNHSLQPAMHFELTGMGVKKLQHPDFEIAKYDEVFHIIKNTMNELYKLT